MVGGGLAEWEDKPRQFGEQKFIMMSGQDAEIPFSCAVCVWGGDTQVQMGEHTCSEARGTCLGSCSITLSSIPMS